jgi:hypothetical protein
VESEAIRRTGIMKRFTITSGEKGKITVGYLGTGSVRAGMMNFTASS